MSKEKQIEEMANTIYDNRPHKDVWLEDAQDIAKVLYEAGYRKQEWISVEERLPEESAWYLVNIINHFGLDVVTFTHYTKGYGWGVPDVTHWMPLPEPPKMKGGAE